MRLFKLPKRRKDTDTVVLTFAIVFAVHTEDLWLDVFIPKHATFLWL